MTPEEQHIINEIRFWALDTGIPFNERSERIVMQSIAEVKKRLATRTEVTKLENQLTGLDTVYVASDAEETQLNVQLMMIEIEDKLDYLRNES